MAEMYVSLYLEALARLMGSGDRPAQDVMLMSLCQHANPSGWCYPGNKLIGAESGHREDSISGILTRLELMGCIRMVYTQTPRRSEPDRDIQISPYVIALRPEYHEVSVAEWNGYKSQTNGRNTNQTIGITYGENDPQPPPNHLKELPSLSNVIKPPPPPPPETAFSSNAKRKKQGQEQEPNAVGTAPEAQAMPARSAQKNSANAPRPHSARPPSPTLSGPVSLPNVALIKEPLTDDLHERVAQSMKTVTGDGMSIAIARGLVTAHGPALCTAAINLLVKKKNLRSPSGHLRWMIQTGALDAQGDAREEPSEGEKYITGKHADIINH